MNSIENKYLKLFKKEDISKYFINPTFKLLYNELYVYIWIICFYHIFFFIIILAIFYLLIKIFNYTKINNSNL